MYQVFLSYYILAGLFFTLPIVRIFSEGISRTFQTQPNEQWTANDHSNHVIDPFTASLPPPHVHSPRPCKIPPTFFSTSTTLHSIYLLLFYIIIYSIAPSSYPYTFHIQVLSGSLIFDPQNTDCEHKHKHDKKSKVESLYSTSW